MIIELPMIKVEGKSSDEVISKVVKQVNVINQYLQIALQNIDSSNIYMDDGTSLEEFVSKYKNEESEANGFTSTRNDKKARAMFNADIFTMQIGDGSGDEDSWIDKIYFDAESGNYVFDGLLSADVIDALSALITPNLYADKATIAEITVDELDTSDKVQKYLKSDKTDDNYQKIYDQWHKFITAATTGAGTAYATNRKGERLYWTDSSKKAASTEVTSYPVLTYNYETDQVKMKIGFYWDPDMLLYVPAVIMGSGDGNEDSQDGKGMIYKVDGGLCIKYTTYAGLERSIRLLEGGVFITPFELESISFYNNGFSATYSGQTFSYTWNKDLSGRITSLITDDNVTIPVSWISGNM